MGIKELNREEGERFLKENEGKSMTFNYYYKFRFYYDYTDSSGQEYLIVCGDTTGDIYRDEWLREEKIYPYLIDSSIHTIGMKGTY